MLRLISGWSVNQKLAAAALVLGAIALFAAPQRGHAVSISPKELAVIVETEVDHVTPRDLADWIIAGRSDFRLIDLRDEAQYAQYHIPGAEPIALTALPDQDFLPTEKVVLYSEGGIHSAQAWFLLKARGARNAYFLLGGLDAWKDEVVFPRLHPSPSPEQAQDNARMRAIAEHFGGRALEGSAEQAASVAAAPVQLPTIQAPAAPAAPAGRTAPRKRKEGC